MWPTFGKELLTRLSICSLYFDYNHVFVILDISHFCFFVSNFGSNCSSSWSLHTCPYAAGFDTNFSE